VELAAEELGDRAVGVQVDVTRPEDCRRLVAEATGRGDGLDALVTCAGIFHATPFDEITPEEWDRILAVNLRGTFLTCQAAVEAMLPRRSGRIVTIASLAGQTGGLAAGAAYSASKAGVAALTKSIARFAGPHGITANCVNPGVIDTPMTAAWPPEKKDPTIAATPLARMGTADEVAAIVVVLASGLAGFVNGAHVDVNGGLLMS
jgi:3-oxoacyl-[acyl-carrier protein] reductase